MSGGNRVRPLLDDALVYLRSCESLTAPPIESATADDRIASIETCASVDCDRLIDEAPQVRVLQVRESFAFPQPPPLTLRRPHPNIEGLIAFRPVSAQAIAMMPGLRFLKLHRSIFQPEPAVCPGVHAALPPTLEEIWAEDLDLPALRRLPKLRLLQTTLPSGQAAQCRSIAALAALRCVRLQSWKPLSGLDALGGLEHLEELEVQRFSRFNFKSFAGCRQLRSLSLGMSTDLAGIEALPALESLALGGRRAMTLAPLKQLPRLEILDLSPGRAPADLQVIGELTNLRSLALLIGSASSPHTLDSAALFAGLKRLEGLQCLALLEDRNLTPLAGLRDLKYLCFWGAFPEQCVRWLQAQLPDCEIDLTTTSPPPSPPRETKFGPLSAIRDEDGRWTVFQDLRLILLDHETNHDAEDAVITHLATSNPHVLQRVTFDSEADAFCIYADSGDDIQRVADAVEALATRR
jgi:hypothetical protein